MNCKVVHFDSKKVLGMEYFGKNENAEIAKMWEVFMKRASEIKTTSPEISYGLCYDYEDSGAFGYLAGLEAADLDEIQNGMILKEIPEGDYAVFTFNDDITKMPAFWNAIYSEYMPENNLEADYGLSFELYDERFCDHGECDIYIPIKK